MDDQQHIEREVQRRLSAEQRRHHAEVAQLHNVVKEQQEKLIQQHGLIQRLTGEALTFGTVYRLHNDVDPSFFAIDDAVIVTDDESPYDQRAGRIVAASVSPDIEPQAVDENGQVYVNFGDVTEDFHYTKLRLAEKNDGTTAVVSIDGKFWEVKGVRDLDVKVGDLVKVMPETRQIVAKCEYDIDAGTVCYVDAITSFGVEVSNKGEKSLAQNPKGLTLEEGDRVCMDAGGSIILKKLQRDPRERYKLHNELDVTWDRIGGLDEAKGAVRDLLELPYAEPALYAHYNMQRASGVLLYGPPGCGKTLLAKAIARGVADIHGATAISSGFIFVKSPEILDKWVGNTEAEIRNLFERARKHFRDHNYPAVLAFDEADAIMPQRGTRRSSDVADTIVPMFLGEMDGIDEEQTRCNPIIILMTNRVDVLDPAIIRPGRISHHIKVERPDQYAAMDILNIHSAKVPFQGKKDGVLAIAASDIYSKSRVLYRINGEHNFTFGDAINGAMLEHIMEEAKLIALRRDIANKAQTGVDAEDVRTAINKVFQQQQGLNHSYDLIDFADKHHIQSKDMQVSRCFGAA